MTVNGVANKLKKIKDLLILLGIFFCVCQIVSYARKNLDDNGQINKNLPRSIKTDAPPPDDIISLTGNVLDWHQPYGGGRHVFVYSAYLDRRRPTEPCIKLVAFIRRKRKLELECTYWFASNKITTVNAGLRHIIDYKLSTHTASFILCPVYDFDPNDHILRVTISTIRGTSRNYTGSIPVQIIENRQKLGELNVCVKIVHSNFNNAIRLIEFMEMYKLLGSEHFIFYNSSIGPDVEAVLQNYVEEGIVEMLPWTPTLEDEVEMFYYGEHASQNDCVLRSIKHFPLTLMVDVDEFVIPKAHENLLDLVEYLGNYSDYVFRNTFFYLGWEDDQDDYDILNRLTNRLITQKKTRRVETPMLFLSRSKYLMRPENVIEAGSHNVWEFIDGLWKTSDRTLDVPTEAAVSQHYRNCLPRAPDCLGQPSLIDKGAQRFMEPLVNSISRTCRRVFPSQPNCPPPPY